MSSSASKSYTFNPWVWIVMALVGPLLWGGEIVGPVRGVDWEMLSAALVGTAFWAGIVLLFMCSVVDAVP